jgi:hypothetical protein
MEPMKKLREVLVPQPDMRKNLYWILKIHLHFPRIASRKRHTKQAKNVKFGKNDFFFGKAIFWTPPKVVSSFRGGETAGL